MEEIIHNVCGKRIEDCDCPNPEVSIIEDEMSIQEKVVNRLHAMDSISLSFSQYTIDIIAECLEIATNINDYMPRFNETLGSKCYQIDTVLKVMNPILEEDIAILKEIVSLFNEWQTEIESIDKI